MGYPEYEAVKAGPRRAVSQNMALAKTKWPQAKPHAYTACDIDISALERVRAAQKELFREKHGVSLRMDLFFMLGLLDAVRAAPILNSCYEVSEKDGKLQEQIRQYRSMNLGIAIAHPRQLMTVAILEAEKKSFVELAQLLDVIYNLPRVEDPRKILAAHPELELGTSTITFNNAGGLGPAAEYGYSIIEPGASVILTIHRSRNVVTWREVEGCPVFVPSRLVCTSVSFDHRPFDGREAVKPLDDVKKRIEDPAWSSEVFHWSLV